MTLAKNFTIKKNFRDIFIILKTEMFEVDPQIRKEDDNLPRYRKMIAPNCKLDHEQKKVSTVEMILIHFLQRNET